MMVGMTLTKAQAAAYFLFSPNYRGKLPIISHQKG